MDGCGAMRTEISLTVNGRAVTAEVEPRMLLVEFLRRTLRLTGTHVGCDTGQCGACAVHLDGVGIKSCALFAVQAAGRTVVTIEGVSPAGGLNPLQAAFKARHALQCGFCTPGMIMSALDMIRRHPQGLTEAVVRDELEGNLCRCTGYNPIVAAILDGAAALRGRPGGESAPPESELPPDAAGI